MAKSRLPVHVHHHQPSPCPSSSANGEDVQPLLDQGEKHSAGVIHSLSSHYSVIPLSTSDESQSNKVDSKSERGEGEEEDLEKRHGAGQNPMIIASPMSAVAEGPLGIAGCLCFPLSATPFAVF